MEMMEPDAPSSLKRRISISTPVAPPKLSLANGFSTSSSSSSTSSSSTASSSSTSSSSTASSSSFPAVDFELVSLKSLAYTSLKDLLPSTGAQSPTASSAGSGACYSGCEISIRNRLVKQAAWAYLQPMSSSPDSSGGHFFSRLWSRFCGAHIQNPFVGCLGFINLHIIPTITKAVDRLLGAIRVWTTRTQ